MTRRTLHPTKKVGVLFLLGIFFLGGILVLAPGLVLAQPELGLTYAADTGLGTSDIRVLVARIIRVFLGLLGIIAVGIIVYAGFLWMTSRGNEETVLKAKTLIKDAIIGLAIILSAFSIVTFIISRLGDATGFGDGTSGLPGTNGFIGVGVGSSNLGSHYPPRDASGIPRNAKVIVTFKIAMAPSTIIDSSDSAWNQAHCAGVASDVACGKLNHVELFPSAAPSLGLAPDQVRAMTVDNRTFVFKPLAPLGSPTAPTPYTAVLENEILTGQGAAVFGATGSDYNWNFEVSTVTDLTPPKVTSVIPRAGATEPRNTVVEITFNEAVDPTTVSGSRAQFGVWHGAAKLSGTTAVSNGYRTVEFVSDQSCGTNSCGGTIFCLPASADLTAKATAARLSAEPPAAVDPPDGVADLAGNSLDGNGNGRVEGPEIDSYSWSFKTTAEIDTIPPLVTVLSPSPGAGNVLRTTPIQATFSKTIRSASVTAESFKLFFAGQPFLGNYRVGVDDAHTGAWLETTNMAVGMSYTPLLTSQIQDTRQNCYFPCAANGTACFGARWSSPYPSCRL